MYKIKLQNFEGPLDLLLFFVRKDELNIYDIPIARITKSYLEYLQLMQDLNLDVAGEFILMAATLMRIKAKSMLPPDPTDEEEEMMDPREELSRRLVEYRQFKEASKTLSEMDEYWRTVYRRSYFNFDLLPPNQEEAVGLKDISFFDLLAAYKNALAKRPKTIFHNIERINVTVEDQQKYIAAFFRDRTCYLFTELCEDMGKIEILVTFLALLDLIRKGDIAVKQASIFDDIWIYKAEEFKEDEIPEAERAIPAEDMTAEIQSMTEPAGDAETEAMIEVTEEFIADEMIDKQEIDEIKIHELSLPPIGQNSEVAETISDLDEPEFQEAQHETLDSSPLIGETHAEGVSTNAVESGETETIQDDQEPAAIDRQAAITVPEISESGMDADGLEFNSSVSDVRAGEESIELTPGASSENSTASDPVFSARDKAGSKESDFLSTVASEGNEKNVIDAPAEKTPWPLAAPPDLIREKVSRHEDKPAEKMSLFRKFVHSIVRIVKKLFS